MTTNKVKSDRELLAISLADKLNKRHSDYQIAYILGNDNFSPSDIPDWISTGSSMLDIAISNRAHGGIPISRISEISGAESSGKTLLAAHILANVQKKNGIAVFIDTENAVSTEFLEAIGVDLDKMVYSQPETIEEVFDVVLYIIETVRADNRDTPIAIVVDSIAATPTIAEVEGDFEKAGYNTDKAIVISQALRKITKLLGREKIALVFTNQLRMNMGAMSFADPFITPGGKALPFHASVRIRLKKIGQVKDSKRKTDNVIGIKCKAQVIKSRVGPPLRQAEFNILFDSGIDDMSSWLITMKDFDMIKLSGSWYTYVDIDSGNEYKFLSKDFGSLLDKNVKLKEQIYQRICDARIMKYKSRDDTISDEASNG